MLTQTDFKEINTTRGVIEHVKTGEVANRIPFETILALLDFILLGIKAIFFDKMGKPKSKLQLILSLPAIISFVREVIVRISGDVKKPNRVKALSNEAKVAKAIEVGVSKTAYMKGGDLIVPVHPELKERIENARRANKSLSDPNSKKGANG
jgi:hypothetical protein